MWAEPRTGPAIISNMNAPQGDCAHGAGLAAVMSAVLEYHMHHNIIRFTQAAVRIRDRQMDCNHPETTACSRIRAFHSFLRSIGMPGNFSEPGAKAEDIPAIAHRACFGGGRSGILEGFAPLTESDIIRIYESMV